jgi:hypothetical protein
MSFRGNDLEWRPEFSRLWPNSLLHVMDDVPGVKRP